MKDEVAQAVTREPEDPYATSLEGRLRPELAKARAVDRTQSAFHHRNRIDCSIGTDLFARIPSERFGDRDASSTATCG